MLKQDIVLATNNRHKQREISHFFSQKVLIPEDLGVTFEIEESATTFVGNALLKAQALYQLTGKATLADDSGLVIEALPHILGVHSARFAPQMSQEEKNEHVIDLMRGVVNRQAYFVCAMVLYHQQESFISVQSTWIGSIAHEVKGNNGFGYDAIFKLEDGRHVAQLSAEEKAQCSHRAKALNKLNHWFHSNEDGG
ncbi:RdgB/HAM1 family non-canonical purine NTP pyrophosphatase [Entomospira culicis]|uniref:dITP/XTP pyrophosphatase n=1 Tax=Entomospira culicis TaxID=2719989 RepID=A0A968KVX2_9SPIO|nr:RdgB/HAM1 family non-canonical purine NTP pyrophosphatase [Entomospira culicis]NIZ19487.1 RdgB/HAM1 family non-canonical purine NTP pyrophosphatase [Entomospira culicis]NIZ69608.1 RdgB/HAM1 family non-canonical purine NTP pyrophosphatase [Entomospira culicis]WDI36719.1 RdgB/HAM1 family non-canonical purine NTP pyrophosphatase [Entomospira culicis]WDI38348.1 RdgB/HAM1 family non-canonical purine NTP pyrophosphatase [Entomospira culicis]